MVCCNGMLNSVRKNQFSMYLGHGTSVKSVHEYYNLSDDTDYCLATGEAAVDTFYKCFCHFFKKEK